MSNMQQWLEAEIKELEAEIERSPRYVEENCGRVQAYKKVLDNLHSFESQVRAQVLEEMHEIARTYTRFQSVNGTGAIHHACDICQMDWERKLPLSHKVIDFISELFKKVGAKVSHSKVVGKDILIDATPYSIPTEYINKVEKHASENGYSVFVKAGEVVG